jgi:hypothetical protein
VEDDRRSALDAHGREAMERSPRRSLGAERPATRLGIDRRDVLCGGRSVRPDPNAE